MRVTSASWRSATGMCGSANSTLVGPAGLPAAEDGTATGVCGLSDGEGDIHLFQWLSLAIEPAIAVMPLVETVRHIGLCKRGGARRHPSRQERRVVGWRARLAVIGPCSRQNALTLDQAVIMGLIGIGP